MRGRVFSAFYVMRDVIFLLGMASAGLADIVDIRVLIIFSSLLLFVSAAFTFVAPGLGISTWRAAAARLRASGAAPGLEASPVRAATLADFDLLAGRIGAFTSLSAGTARVVPGGRHGPPRPERHAHRRARRHRVLRVLHPRWLDDGRHPDRGRLSRPVDHDGGRFLRGDRRTHRQSTDRRRRGRHRYDPARDPAADPSIAR